MKLKSFGWMYTALLLAIFAGATVLHAQVVGGTFTGEVRDASGAVVPEATIIIKNTSSDGAANPSRSKSNVSIPCGRISLYPCVTPAISNRSFTTSDGAGTPSPSPSPP